MGNRFPSKKDPKLGAVLLAVVAALYFLGVGLPWVQNGNFETVNWWAISVVILPVLGLLIWIWLQTEYKIIGGTTLHYRSGPLNGTVPIQSISKIHLHEVPIIGLKPTLSWDTMRICFNDTDEIYISPRNEADFLDILQIINPSIEIIDNEKEHVGKGK